MSTPTADLAAAGDSIWLDSGGGDVWLLGEAVDIPNLICVHNITANKPSATGITAHNPVAANIARVEC